MPAAAAPGVYTLHVTGARLAPGIRQPYALTAVAAAARGFDRPSQYNHHFIRYTPLQVFPRPAAGMTSGPMYSSVFCVAQFLNYTYPMDLTEKKAVNDHILH